MDTHRLWHTAALVACISLWGCRSEPAFPVDLTLTPIQGTAAMPAAPILWVTPEAIYLSQEEGAPGTAQGTEDVELKHILDLKSGRIPPALKQNPEEKHNPVVPLMAALDDHRNKIRAEPNSIFSGDLNLFLHPLTSYETLGLVVYTAGMAQFSVTGFAVGTPGAVGLVPLHTPAAGDGVLNCFTRPDDAPPVSADSEECLQLVVSIHDDGFRVKEEGTLRVKRPVAIIPRGSGPQKAYDYEALYQVLKTRRHHVSVDDFSNSLYVGAEPHIPNSILVRTIDLCQVPRPLKPGGPPEPLFERAYITWID